MPYVSRNDKKQINGVYAIAQWPFQESLADDNPEIVFYLASQPTADGGASLLARIAALESNMAAVLAVPAVAIALPAPTPLPLNAKG